MFVCRGHPRAQACVVPLGGWSPDPPKSDLALSRIGQVRANMLLTRGLLVMRLPSPPPPTEGWIKWLVAPSSDCNVQHTWYLDGSLHDGCWTEYRAAGFGIVVVAPDASLVAYGLGVPPSWCNTAAAAETWALHTALSQSAFPPQLRTDCQSLLTIASEGTAQATGASRPLARVWKLIAASLDGCIESVIESGLLVWMPAHQALNTIVRKNAQIASYSLASTGGPIGWSMRLRRMLLLQCGRPGR